VLLPLYNGMTGAEQAYVIDQLRAVATMPRARKAAS
jgi:hypothetical protein